MTFLDMFSVLDHLAVNEIPCFYGTRISIIIGQFSEPVEPDLSPPFCLRPKPVLVNLTWLVTCYNIWRFSDEHCV